MREQHNKVLLNEIKANITNGVASILWGDAWAQHIESAQYDGRKPCKNLSGCKIEEVMPELPKCAKQKAMLLMRAFCFANNKSIVSLFVDSAKANMGVKPNRLTEAEVLHNHGLELENDLQTRFGECLAWMAMGTGVSWFDDFATFPLKVPHVDNYELQLWAINHCNECNNNQK